MHLVQFALVFPLKVTSNQYSDKKIASGRQTSRCVRHDVTSSVSFPYVFITQGLCCIIIVMIWWTCPQQVHVLWLWTYIMGMVWTKVASSHFFVDLWLEKIFEALHSGVKHLDEIDFLALFHFYVQFDKFCNKSVSSYVFHIEKYNIVHSLMKWVGLYSIICNHLHCQSETCKI